MKNTIDKLIGYFSPGAGLERLRARRLMAAYEAVKPTRTRRNPSDNSSGEVLAEASLAELRGQARHLEQNYDFAFSILNSLVNNVVGPRGIGVEFQPKRLDGTIHQELAAELNRRWAEWCRRPEVTRSMSYGKAQRMAAFTWLRDGEVLKRSISGNAPGIGNPTGEQYAIELLEPDFLPHDYNDETKRIVHGVEKNAWGKAVAYHLYDEHPGGARYWRMRTRRRNADEIAHLKMVRRLHQTRGLSIFATVMSRINDIKDYEEAERVAARIAATMVGYIRKGTPDLYQAPEGEDDDGNRLFGIAPGTIWDNLQEGEDVGILESNRPSGLLTPFLETMQRMAAGGTMASFSTITRNYNGTYSAQRQEMVEQWVNYEVLSCEFIEMFVEPDVRNWVSMLQLARDFSLPGDVDPESLRHIDFVTPAMPWIDPVKESGSNKTNLEIRTDSPQRIIRRRGGNPMQVLDQIEQWNNELERRGITGQPSQPEPPPDPGSAEDPEQDRDQEQETQQTPDEEQTQ
jgi:lambda family phage portal protein